MLYRCAGCGKGFISDKDEEEALKESKVMFGNIPRENLVIICDDCYKEMFKHVKVDQDNRQTE